MTRYRLLTVAVLTAAAVVASAGVAAADGYTGETYGDAVAQLSEAGETAIISSRTGDALPEDECVVTHAQKASWLKGDDFSHVTDTVLLDLNCNAPVATAKTPGNSAASPQGRAALKASKQASKQASQ
ncbi:Uncharacterised protein [Mycolicibacterium phlei]|jgi:hypothetical protein|uniref:PASTA domain-containing protein n=2 Tax=Mycolicibacterium phlei TaxID=1771 RepID=A0A5N5UXH1_MYCPH|nr:hypothetical protein [Mycolicibacterium phlei]VEG11852.1 Uncharacterised protein [Mycobacteroides chelonae]AMO63760.1 hypothetical protein MPHLCCUG_04975 [Mycolicibacterium phlei]EID11389.1 hypothetical protein MPHLEI_19634 [Mycolicibacterium phlei RIVM601174]KAB7754305.1 hypothetical protein MPHL21000_17145 [Mycolicibacterium phlei DSM 43239 = CCUG 21000]KXW63897.1 hypothetical protein MPHL43239_14625 [Mycolicibacterium phlei DSM 43239 = CCUG 21000]